MSAIQASRGNRDSEKHFAVPVELALWVSDASPEPGVYDCPRLCVNPNKRVQGCSAACDQPNRCNRSD